MTASTRSEHRLPVALLVLRLLIFGVFLMWAFDKLLAPEQAARIYQAYFSLPVSQSLVTLIGAAELVLLGAFLIGYQKRFVRAVMLVLMGIACLAPGRFYLTPFEDHILLYFAAFPAFAVTFMLYYLRDRDTLFTLPAPAREAQTPTILGSDDSDPRLPLCLLLIRVAVFFDLFMWNMDKFFQPLQTSRIFAGFYSVGAGLPFTSQLSYAAVYVMGTLQLLVILAFLVGFKKRFFYGLIFLLHTVSTFAPWERFLSPLTSHTLLFLVSFPMLGGIGAMYYLRNHDVLWTVRERRRAGAAAGLEGEAQPRTAALMPLRFWSWPARITLAALVVAGVYLLATTALQWRTERALGPTLVSELESRTTPAAALTALSPEMATADWMATWHSANCTFDHPEIDDCWEIHFAVWVPGLPEKNVMPGPRQVEAAWIVDGAGLAFHPDRNARNYFALAPGHEYASPVKGG
jgi:putative oxidoreductase